MFQVLIPVTCPVGIWHCSVQTTTASEGKPEIKEYKISDDIYILFNPYCKGKFTLYFIIQPIVKISDLLARQKYIQVKGIIVSL